MEKLSKNKKIKLNLSLEKDFYDLLKEKAKNDYVKVATWVKQYLMKNLLDKNNSNSKSLI